MGVGAEIGRGGPSVVIAMGDRGVASRVVPDRFGSVWTYAGSLSAVGQLDVRTLIETYRFRALSPMAHLYGLVGLPIGHSVSPAMHNAAFRATSTDAVYLPLPACDADDFMSFARGVGLKGASVTIPFKVALFERVDETDEPSRPIGAINTLQAVDGRWMGLNTDVSGFMRPLRERAVQLRGVRAAILGAGGSARAVAVALARSGAVVSVHARNGARANDVAALASGRVGGWPVPPGSWDVLVNCTPIGMHPHIADTPVSMEALTGRVVYDLVYNPPDTRLLREAARAGCVAIGGLDMLVGQAEEQFHIWTNVRPPAGVMRAAAVKRLAEFVGDEHHVI